MSAGSIIRPTGPLERFYAARHHLGMISCVVVSAKYVGTENNVLDKARLFSALENVIRRHGALGVRIIGESSDKPVYARLSTIDLSKVVDFVEIDETGLAEALESQILRGFETDADLPLWRLQVLKDGTINFAWHHIIGDGQSGVAFHHALLSALNDVQQPSIANPPIIQVPQDSTLVPHIESIINVSVSPITLCREVLKLFIPASWTASASSWTGNAVPEKESLVAQVRLLQFSAEDGKRLVLACRAHRTTLTPLLYTLTATILSKLLVEDESAKKYSFLSASIPISLRKLTKTSPYEMCNHISGYHQYVPITRPKNYPSGLTQEAFPWSAAETLTATLQKQLTQSAGRIGLLKFVSNYETFLKRCFGKKRDVTFEVSNLGRFPSEVHGGDDDVRSGERAPKWSISHVYFTQAQPVSGPLLYVNVVGTPDGGLGISITWSEGAIDDSVGEAFVNSFRQALDEMILAVDR